MYRLVRVGSFAVIFFAFLLVVLLTFLMFGPVWMLTELIVTPVLSFILWRAFRFEPFREELALLYAVYFGIIVACEIFALIHFLPGPGH